MQPLPEFPKELTTEQQFTQQLLALQIKNCSRETLEGLVLNAHEALAIKDNLIKVLVGQLTKGESKP